MIFSCLVPRAAVAATAAVAEVVAMLVAMVVVMVVVVERRENKYCRIVSACQPATVQYISDERFKSSVFQNNAQIYNNNQTKSSDTSHAMRHGSAIGIL